MAESTKTQSWRIGIVVLLAILLGIGALMAARFRRPELPPIPVFTTAVGAVREPLPYRIVSFHRGRADKNLIKLASQLGFNGVQFQIEGSNEEGIKDFAARDQREHLIDYCHALGMKVTVWVHELSDLPDVDSPDYLGPVSADNEKLWSHLDQSYRWILEEMIPKADGLVLTVVETQENATETPVMLKLVDLIDHQCRAHGKSLIVRTFVWHPEELEGVMGAIKQLPPDIVVMSKIVPQDWQMRGPFAAEIGAVGGRPQIIEFDAAGEYFLKNAVANCMVDLLEKQFNYCLDKGAQGICVRVDRVDDSVLFEPSEVNVWTLGLLSAGATLDKDEIWRKWAAYRYGEKAAPAVIAALKPTGDVVAELLSVGDFTFGDTRRPPAAPWDDIFTQNWQPWQWNASYRKDFDLAEAGDPGFVERVQRQKADAMKIAAKCLSDLEAAKPDLPEREYQILQTRLWSNQFQLAFRTPMIMAALRYRQLCAAGTKAQFEAAKSLCLADITDVQKIANGFPSNPPKSYHYLGKIYNVNQPLGISADELTAWVVRARLVAALDF